MPADYKKKQKEMLRQIKEQYGGEPLEGPLRVDLELRGEGRADLDNMTGAFLDVANKVLWVDDRVSIIPEISARWSKCKKDQSVWRITVYQIIEEDEDFLF